MKCIVDEDSQGTILTRIYIREDGDLLVTDLWEEVRLLLEGPTEEEGGGDAQHSSV